MVYVAFSFCVFLILLFMYKSGHMIKSLFFSLLQGGSALFAVNLIGEFISIHLPLNLFTSICCTVGGIPGVIFLTLYDLFYKLTM